MLFRWIPENGTGSNKSSYRNYVSNLDRAALRAMTGPEGESAVMLFGIVMQLLKLCGAIHDFNCCFSLFSTPCPKGYVLNIDYQYDTKHIMLIDLLLVKIQPDQTSLFKILKTIQNPSPVNSL